MSRKYPFRNLVFKGGGIKAFAYIGAMQAFEEHKVLSKIDRVAGNSAGSLMATLVSFRKDAQDTSIIIATLDFSKVASMGADEGSQSDSSIPQVIKRREQKIKGGMNAISRLYQNYGLFSSDFLQNWLQEVIAQECHGNGKASFADFRKFGFRDVHIVATNVSTHQVTEFSAATTPDIPVAEAAIASSSIPFFYEPRQFKSELINPSDYFVDGGVLTNYPIHLFDHPKYEKGNRHFDQGVNWETLGCRLFTPEECKEEIEPITNLPSFVKNLVETLSITEDITFTNTLIDQLRTIDISNCCVGTKDFSVRPGTEKYDELVAAGWSATNEFLEGYQSPKDRLSGIRERFREYFGK
ncbi:MAG: patatin-like phospholipase family protein [Anaerolineales bacterium]|nr:patatin-like phospholipase family protein [Anaerolineales bacterium]